MPIKDLTIETLEELITKYESRVHVYGQDFLFVVKELHELREIYYELESELEELKERLNESIINEK